MYVTALNNNDKIAVANQLQWGIGYLEEANDLKLFSLIFFYFSLIFFISHENAKRDSKKILLIFQLLD